MDEKAIAILDTKFALKILEIKRDNEDFHLLADSLVLKLLLVLGCEQTAWAWKQ